MAEWNRTTPWRQGDLLSKEAILALNLVSGDVREAVVMVASHDCDLTQAADNEPDVEVMVGQVISAIDGNYSHAKTPRVLHIQFEGGLLAEFTATEKHKVPKLALTAFNPDTRHSLSPEAKTVLQRWLAARYRRSAFPDEFENRLVRQSKLAEKIAKAVKPHGNSIVAVFFDVDEGQEIVRTSADDTYMLDIYLLFGDLPDYETAEVAANTAKNAIESAFRNKLFDNKTKNWRLIELRYIEVVYEGNLTYKQYRDLKPWRLEHVSLKAEPQQSILHE